MNWLFKLLGSDGTNQASVDANGSQKVTGPTTLSQVGFSALAGRNDDGTVTGTPRVQRVYATEAGQGLKSSTPVILWDDTFNATAQNTSKYNFAATTQTGTMGSGFLNLNASAITTINTNSGIQTFRSFPLIGKSELRANFSLTLSAASQVNNLIEFGLFSAVLTTRVAPTDGVLFRYNASAELRAVINFNGTETTKLIAAIPSANVNHDYTIVVTTDSAIFYIDGVVVATIVLSVDATLQGQPYMMGSQPLTIRTYIGGSAPSTATTVKVTDVFVTILGPELSKSWSEIKAGYGHMAYQGQNGGTMGTTANLLNGATPAAAALTNTATSAGSPAGLGGLAHVLPTLTAGSDGILFSYQNPAGSINQTPRSLIVKSVTLSGGINVVLAGGPLVLAYSLAYGHTAVSLATAEAASFTAAGTTKAPRRIWLGVHTAVVTAAAGTPLNPGQIKVDFSSPVVVAPGEFIAITMRNQGTITTTGSVVITCSFDAYFE